MSSPDTLESYLDFMERNDIDDDRIYAHLTQVNASRLRLLLTRLQRVDGFAAPSKGKKAFEGKRSELKGRIYEEIVGVLLGGVRCFESWQNVTSTTNELDILAILGPASRHVPVLREWGTHCICECKYHSGHVSTNWITKLNTVLQTHGASVGLLFSRRGIATQGRGTQIRVTLQLLSVATPARFMLCFSWDDLVQCSEGANFLQMITRRFVEVRAGARKLDLLAG